MGLMGCKKDVSWAEELLRRFALEKQRDAYTRTLSGGMKRRLLVAKALVHRPKLLFLDEPTAGVDVELRKELWREVSKLRDNGTTIILTTHYLKEAEQLADRIGILHHGKLLLVEEREALMKRNRTYRVVATLGERLRKIPEGLPPNSELLGSDRLLLPWRDADELVRHLSELGENWTIHSLDFEQNTLEDIFVDLIHASEATK